MAHAENVSADNVVILPGLCKQHASGLCMAPLVKSLGIASPAFCISKQLRQDKFYTRFLCGVRLAIQVRLHWVRESEDPTWRPRAQDVRYAEQVLELAYYTRDLRTCKDEADANELRLQDRLRRQRGQVLIERCPGNWRSKLVTHWCRGCCQSEEQVVDLVFRSVLDVTFHTVAAPCLVKWLSLWPLISDLTVMASFHSVFMEGLRYAIDACHTEKDQEGEDALSEMSEAELVATHPTDDKSTWHKQERRRCLKIVRFFETPGTLFKMMCYLHITGPVMRLHYTLFKYATVSPVDGSRQSKSYLYNLCDVKRSVAVDILVQLTGMLRSRVSLTEATA